MKIVLDTNILIDAWKDDFSYERRIIDEIINGNVEAYASHKIWREYELILNRLVNDKGHHELSDRLMTNLQMVYVDKEVRVVKYDKEDNKFFSAALAAGADYIISKDLDLHEVGEYKGVKVATAEDFWHRYKADTDDNSEWRNWVRMVIK